MQTKQAIIRSAVDIAERIHASTILLPDSYTSERIGIETEIPVVVMPRQASDMLYRIIPNHVEKEEVVLHERTRKVAVAGYLEGAISGTIVGVIDGLHFDSIIVYDPRESYAVKSLQEHKGLVNSDAFRAVMKLALELALEGREGRHIGTAFIIGDERSVLRASHQLLLNPFKGHDPHDRMITDRDNWETFKEFAQLDGVFVISDEGTVCASGRYLDADARSVRIQQGLGGRHAASAAITAETEAVAVVVSESGVIRVYQDGEQIIEIEPGGLGWMMLP
uniref:Diadenylate cyclase n=1 Tax=Candidatus Methanogaster sp. ANME-2c ERB4 TaxID=2759911 RepID=A0A7G9YPQ8_9EURY|nr:diadenylate cyclase [Methanosarcinales archaeon ANME-2c ERB4]